MTEQAQPSISYEVVTTDEATWKPPEKQIDVVLEPKPGEEPYYPPSTPKVIDVVLFPKENGGVVLPPASPYPPSTPADPITSACVINIETTGLMPFDSRLISIAAVDLAYPENIIDFTGQNEEEVLRTFFDWFVLGNYQRVIGYNVGFDYRFLFAKAMKYGIPIPDFYHCEIYDVMNKMKQVKEEFVYNFNTPGKLDEWSMYFFGEKAPMTFEEVLAAWENKDLDRIAVHNRKKVEMCMALYALVLYAQGDLIV